MRGLTKLLRNSLNPGGEALLILVTLMLEAKEEEGEAAAAAAATSLRWGRVAYRLGLRVVLVTPRL